jgi:hypothetical protein
MAARQGSPDQTEKIILEALFNGMTAWQQHAAEEARTSPRTGAPVDTGRLARSIREDTSYPIESKPLVMEGQFGAHTEYAMAHEFGSGIHAVNPADRELIVIEAGFWTGKSDKRALNFAWPEGPTDISAYNSEGQYAGTFTFRKVFHPGVPAVHDGKGYLRFSARESVPFGRRAIMAALTGAIRRARAT